MRIILSLFALVVLAACSTEPDVPQAAEPVSPEILQYLYKVPVSGNSGLSVGRVKNEALAEAFVSRFSAKKPAGIVVLQEEKLVLEEYFHADSNAYICLGSFFPAYTGALLGALSTNRPEVPFQSTPLELFYSDKSGPVSFLPVKGTTSSIEADIQKAKRLDSLIDQQLHITQGLAAEELLLEPLQIDDYIWQQGSLCMHPHEVLKLASLWLRRGRWKGTQLLPDKLVQKVLAPAYQPGAAAGNKAFGWQYYRMLAKGRRHVVLYWQNGKGAHLFLLPETEAVVLLQGGKELMPDALLWMQQYLVPALTP